jgi:hypothetical protein
MRAPGRAGQGRLIDFLQNDYSFYTSDHEAVSLPVQHWYHLKGHITSIHLRFRFDKSPRNFSVCKFRRIRTYPILDPMAAAASCIHRGNPAWEPIGAFDTISTYSFLCDSHITTIMQKTCLWALGVPHSQTRNAPIDEMY